MDLGDESETVIDALTTLRQGLRSPRIVITPTPQRELAHIARFGETEKECNKAIAGIEAAQRWRIEPVNLAPVGPWDCRAYRRPLACRGFVAAGGGQRLISAG